MNAQTKITAAQQSLEFHVKSYVEGADGENLAHRVTLLKARDHAAQLLGIVDSPIAQHHASEVHQLAGAMVFRVDTTDAKLKQAVEYCRALVKAAHLAEDLGMGCA